MIVDIASRAARHDDVVADLQGLSVDALLGQLAGGAPLDRPAHRRALVILQLVVLDYDEGVRIPQQKLLESSLHLNRRRVLEIRSRKGVMGKRRNPGEEHSHTGRDQCKLSFHFWHEPPLIIHCYHLSLSCDKLK